MPSSELRCPTIWHPDLSGKNIMVSENLEITGIIDWQHTIVGPYFILPTFAPAMAYEEGVFPLPEGPRLPKLPADYDSYSQEKQSFIRRHHRLIIRHKAYETFMLSIPRRRAAHALPNMLARATLPYDALRSWSDGIHRLVTILFRISGSWSEIVGDDSIPCPIELPDAEFQEYVDDLFRRPAI